MWIKGEALLLAPYNFSRSLVFRLVKAGKLIPRELYSSMYRDPNDLPGSRRYFWLLEHKNLEGTLSFERYQIGYKRSWLEGLGSEVEGKYSREEIEKRTREYPAEIKEGKERVRLLEEELRPDRVWQFNAAPDIQEEIISALVEKCVYWEDENEVLTACSPPEINPAFDQSKTDDPGLPPDLLRAIEQYKSGNPDATLSELANLPEAKRAFPNIAPGTRMKRLQRYGLVKKGRRANK